MSLFPKVEKLHKNAIKVQFQYDEALINAEKKRLEKLQEVNKKKEAPKPARPRSSRAPMRSGAGLNLILFGVGNPGNSGGCGRAGKVPRTMGC